MFICPEVLLKTGPMFTVIKAVSHQWRFCGWVICPHFIAHQAWEALPGLSAGFWTCSWASFKTAVTLARLSSLKSLLSAPNSLPIPLWLNIQITSQSVLALYFGTGHSAILAVTTTTCQWSLGLWGLWASRPSQPLVHRLIWRCSSALQTALPHVACFSYSKALHYYLFSEWFYTSLSSALLMWPA